jgi:hypothetical protein
VFFSEFEELAVSFRDRSRLREADANARASRRLFAFDTHVDDLVAFFHRAIARHGQRRPDVRRVRPSLASAGAHAARR